MAKLGGGIVVFADLDDTLFQTLRKLPETERAGLRAATVDTRGEPHSFSTPAQQALLGWLGVADWPGVPGAAPAGPARSAPTLVPVTGRDVSALRRVLLPLDSWQVADHGMTILTPQGEPDSVWAARVLAHLIPLQDELRRLSDEVAPLADAVGCRLTSHAAHGVPFMSVVKHPGADPQALWAVQERWTASVGEGPLQVIANANNVSLLPRALGKAQAVRYLRQRVFADAALCLGLGDSVSDLGFLQECDFALTPQRGQLLRALAGLKLPQR